MTRAIVCCCAILTSCAQNSPLDQAPVFHPQFVFSSSGELLLAWCEQNDSGANLFLARVDGKNQISNPTPVNHIPNLVNSSPFDELRPSIAVGQTGLLAIGFTDKNWDVQVVISRDDGETFEPAIKLNQDTTRAMQSFVNVAFNSDGGLHCVWIDPREAPAGQEEPCDLYYAVVKGGRVTEKNLTAGQVQSVCGCCRPNIAIGDTGAMEIAFRNTDTAGFRDIFQISKIASDEFSRSTRLGSPLWKIDGCPAAGPLQVRGWTLWNDGSTGTLRMLALRDHADLPETVLMPDTLWHLNASPRRIKTKDDSMVMLLVPGTPAAKILQLNDDNWRPIADDIPEWCRDAALSNGHLLLVGSIDGKLKMESRAFELGSSTN